jgi:PAS domain S-box-containing protein
VALLRAEIEQLRQQLRDAEQTILAIRSGGVDAFVMHGPDGDQVYALQSADRPYRLLVESMEQGAATLQSDGVVLYFNRRLAELLGVDPAKLPGAAVTEFVPADRFAAWQALLAQGAAGASAGETCLLRGDGRRLPVHVALRALPRGGQRLISLLVSDLSEQKVRREAERLADRLGRLLAFTAARSEAWTVEQVADVIVQHGLPAVGANSALLALVTDDGRQFQVLRLHGYATDVVERSRLIPADAGWMLTDCLRTGQVLVFSTWEERCARYPGQRNVRAEGGDGAAVIVPLVVKERRVGVLGLGFPTDRTFSPGELEFVTALASDCALSLERSRLYDAERAAHAELQRESARRAEVETALRHSEQRYRTFVHEASEGVWRFELDEPVRTDEPVDEQVDKFFRRAYLAEGNDALARMYGYESADQLTGKRLSEFLLADDPRNREYLRAFIRAGYRLTDAESVERDRDGTRRVFLNNLVGVVDGGRLIMAWGTQRDVTENRRAEEALRASEQRFRLLADMIPSIVWTTAPDGTVLYASEQWRRFTGFTAEQETRDLSRLVLHPDDYEHCTAAWQEALQTGADYEIEERIRRHDGVYRWFLTRARPVRDEHGRITAWFGSSTDIHDRKEAEERFRQLAESIPQLAWMARPDGHIYWYNQRWYAYTGSAPEQVEGWGWQDVHDPKELPKVMERWQASLASGTPFDMVFPLRGADGRFRRFLTRVMPLRDANGRIVHWFGTNTDIEDQKRAEEALQDADRRKDEFLAMLAHELRNPLAPVRNAVAILRLADPRDCVAEQARTMIDRQVAHMARLIDDLLDVSRISRGKVLLRKGPCDLTEIVRTTVEDYRGVLEATGLRLDVDLPDHPMPMHGDRTRLAQALGNLLHNANKFTDAGGRVSVRLSFDPASQLATLSIRDTGIGMDGEMLRRVFDAFSQANRSLDRSRGGLGLGLALVKGLIRLHDGTVQAWSEGRGKGSEFTIRLPLRPSAAMAELGHSSGPAARQRILIVEDNTDAADSLRTLLLLAGHDVHVVCTGCAAIEAVETFRPEAVICDIGLPGGMDGYELARSLRLDPAQANTLLIALTGYGQEDDVRRAHEAGFDWHLTKPVDFDELRRVLATLQEQAK